MAKSGLRVIGLTKMFGDGVRAVDECSFDVEGGEFITLLGPSGCGKSTTLRCIAGLERPTAGRIWIEDDLVTDVENGVLVAPERRNVGMIFQSYALWPHLSVSENVAFPLRMRGWRRKDVSSAVGEALELVGLSGFEQRFPGTLSGGQQQRVSLARGIVYKPRLLLFDEPLSSLDARLRERMRVEIQRLQRRLGITTVYVTHDQVEAMSMSDRVIVIRDGQIRQNDVPKNIYQEPKDAFVASFVGVANFLRGSVVGRKNGSHATVQLEGLPDRDFLLRASDEVRDARTVGVLLRPEEVAIVEPGDPDCTTTAEVLEVNYLGAEYELRVKALGQEVRVKCPVAKSVAPGATIGLCIDTERATVVPWGTVGGEEVEA